MKSGEKTGFAVSPVPFYWTPARRLASDVLGASVRLPWTGFTYSDTNGQNDREDRFPPSSEIADVWTRQSWLSVWLDRNLVHGDSEVAEPCGKKDFFLKSRG
ncbi:hypothetical protein PHBOTO_004524 [Pseudozyma hubeiensis]|nr:hypothetical protein PHBOTO_004524 [Pseudozyma hubeiensis]